MTYPSTYPARYPTPHPVSLRSGRVAVSHTVYEFVAADTEEMETATASTISTFPIILAARFNIAAGASGNQSIVSIALGTWYRSIFLDTTAAIRISASGTGVFNDTTTWTPTKGVWYDAVVEFIDASSTTCTAFDLYYKPSAQSGGWTLYQQTGLSTVTQAGAFDGFFLGTYRDGAGLHFDGQINKAGVWNASISGLGSEFPNENAFGGAVAYQDFDRQVGDLQGGTTVNGGDSASPAEEKTVGPFLWY